METTITPYGCSPCACLRPNLLIKAAAVLLALVATVTAQQRTIIGVYKNFAEGFAVRIPQALKVSPETNPGRNVESAFLCCWDTSTFMVSLTVWSGLIRKRASGMRYRRTVLLLSKRLRLRSSAHYKE